MTAGGYVPAPMGSLALGLNLRDGVDAVQMGEAIDALNVRFNDRGVVQARGGFELLGQLRDPDPGERHWNLLTPFTTRVGAEFLIAGCEDKLVALRRDGGELIDAGTALPGPWSSTRFAVPGETKLWFANAAERIRSFDGLGFNQPEITWTDASGTVTTGHLGPSPRCVGVTADFRLICAGFPDVADGPGGGGALTDLPTPSEDLVLLSEPGNPTKFHAFNYARLRPGDGERIMGIVTWREQTFIFKESAFYVFTGVSTNSEGYPYFQRREVDTGIGLAAPHACVAGRDGVYFAGLHGIYRTTGGAPELISDVVEPVFRGAMSDYCRVPALNRQAIETVRLGFHDETLYVTYPGRGSHLPNTQLVHDPRYGWWTTYDLPAHSFATHDGELVFAGRADAPPVSHRHGIWKLRETLHSDALGPLQPHGRSYETRWRSGWVDYGEPAVKVIRESKVWGGGSPTLSLSKDYELEFDQAVELRFTSGVDRWESGTNPADVWEDGSEPADLWQPSRPVAGDLVRKAIRGTVFSFQFSGTVGGNAGDPRWAVHRCTHHLLSVDPPSPVTR